eukprot:Skav235298  [mRNA]  locus=scaffold3178:4384:18779:- [translate_table: standard]
MRFSSLQRFNLCHVPTPMAARSGVKRRQPEAPKAPKAAKAEAFDAARFGRWLRMMLVAFYSDEEAVVADLLPMPQEMVEAVMAMAKQPIPAQNVCVGALVDDQWQQHRGYTNGSNGHAPKARRYDSFGGTTWRDVANETTKLQTEKGTYVPEYLDPAVHAPEDQGAAHGSAQHRILPRVGHEDLAQPRFHLRDVRCELHLTTEDASEVMKVPELCTFYNPIDIKWPGRDEFGGTLAAAWVDAKEHLKPKQFPKKLSGSPVDQRSYVCHGSYDSINYDKLKDGDASVCIVGHGGFTIENVRTCVERKAKKATGGDEASAEFGKALKLPDGGW